MTEIDKFFEGLPGEEKAPADVLDDKPEEGQAPAEGKPNPEEGEEGEDNTQARKNRRERRLEQKYNETRDMNIALNERIKVLSEAKQFQQEFKPSEDVPSEWTALYGDTPEAKKAWQMNQVLINRAKEEAKAEALTEFNNIQQKAIDDQKKFESVIDTELETLEDDFDVDLTSNAPAARKARREFLELVQKLSPKDEEGNIISYADFGSTFEIYQTSKKDKPSEITNRAKELAARNMGRAPNANAQQQVPQGPMNFQSARKAINKLIN